MNQAQLYSEYRRLIGSPSVDQVSNRELSDYLVSGLDWLANLSDFPLTTDERSLVLVAGVGVYPLPSDLQQLIWIEYNGRRLDAATTWAWERDGVDYRGATAATPTAYAVLGQELILYPPPSEDAVSAVTSCPFRYIASQQGISPSGTRQLGDGDQRLFLLQAAIEWWILHPGEKGEGKQKAVDLKVLRDERLQEARPRWAAPVAGYTPQIRVRTRRMGAAR